MKFSFKDDRASATLVTGIISMLFICLCLGIGVDISKNAYLKSSLSSRAQQSAEVALKNLSTTGSIKEVAADKFVQEYLGNHNDSSFRADETKVWMSQKCSKRKISLNNTQREVKMPYIVITLDTERRMGANSKVVYVSEGGSEPKLVKGSYNPYEKYRVLAAEVHDSTANVILGMFGMNCQDYNSSVSAIAFGSQEDLENEKQLQKDTPSVKNRQS